MEPEILTESASSDPHLMNIEVLLQQCFFKVLTRLLSPHIQLHLKTEERVMLAMVRECVRANWRDLTDISSVMPPPEGSSAESILTNLILVTREAYYRGSPTWGKIFAALAFVTVYIRLVAREGLDTNEILAAKLTEMVLEHNRDWIIQQGGIRKGLKNTFPQCWYCCFLARHMRGPRHHR